MEQTRRRLPARDPVADGVADTERYFNRELSWLSFNERVLEEATNRSHPLLERLRFLSISGNNLDEFYMVRVAGLRGQVHAGIETISPEGATPAEQLSAIALTADRLMEQQQEVWGDLLTLLARADFHVLSPEQLSPDCRQWLERHFLEQIFPVLTPQAIDPAHPFPFIPNKGFSLILELRRASDEETLRALLMLPSMLPRFIRLPGKAARFISLENTIRLFFGRLFPGYELLGDGAFRVIRDSDIEIEEEAEDLVRYYQTAIKRRRRGEVIRLKIEASTPPSLRRLVRDALNVQDRDTTVVTGILGIADLSILVDEDRPDLKFEPYSARASPNASANMAAIVSQRFAPRTSLSTTRTRASRSCWPFSSRPPPTPTSSRSSRRFTVPARTRRSCARWSMPPRPASR